MCGSESDRYIIAADGVACKACESKSKETSYTERERETTFHKKIQIDSKYTR